MYVSSSWFRTLVVLLMLQRGWSAEQSAQTSGSIRLSSGESPAELRPAAQIPVSMNGLVIDLGSAELDRMELDRLEADARCDCPRPTANGIVRLLPDGPLRAESLRPTSVVDSDSGPWSFAIRSPGAAGIRIHFTNFSAGSGLVTVAAADAEGVVIDGPFGRKGPQGRGEFWTSTLPGDTVIVVVDSGDPPTFEIPEIVHGDSDAAGGLTTFGSLAPAAVGDCHLDVMCYGTDKVNPVARNAIVKLGFVSGGRQYVCSGTILRDRDDESDVPYLLTAYHCLHKQTEVDTLETIWLYQRNSCGGILPNYSRLPRTVGGTLLETNPTDGGNDMSFIRLPGVIPPGGGAAGWTTAYTDKSYGVHHPGGSWKRVTFFVDDFLWLSGCLFMDASDYHFVRAVDGLTEGGASGSGLFNSAGQLMGQLYGHCCGLGYGSDCSDLTCDSNPDDWRAVYGEFATTYPIIEHWLEIGGTIHVSRTAVWPSSGTPASPFPSVEMAHDKAWNGARIKIKAGTYPENITLSKNVVIVADGGPVVIGK